jgi:CPA1 family monovalent cation:H+ antiporter
LQARALTSGIAGYSAVDLLVAAATISAVVILARFIWTFPAIYLPRKLIASIARKDPAPPWQWSFAIAFTGVRGIVSLAAALAIPLTLENGLPFPNRDFILFITFSVILATLVGQGLLLPVVIRALGLAHAGKREHQAEKVEELAARRQSILTAGQRLDELAKERALPDEVVHALRAQHEDRVRHFEAPLERPGLRQRTNRTIDEIELLLLESERQRVNDLYRRGELKDEPRRRIERELDLRDAQLNTHQHED